VRSNYLSKKSELKRFGKDEVMRLSHFGASENSPFYTQNLRCCSASGGGARQRTSATRSEGTLCSVKGQENTTSKEHPESA
jgi:hypothetical protein